MDGRKREGDLTIPPPSSEGTEVVLENFLAYYIWGIMKSFPEDVLGNATPTSSPFGRTKKARLLALSLSLSLHG